MSSRRAAWMIAAVVLALIAGGYVISRQQPESISPVSRVEPPPPPAAQAAPSGLAAAPRPKSGSNASPKAEPAPKPSDAGHSYLGTVVDDAGKGVAGAVVSFWGGGDAETRTDAEGKFTFSGTEASGGLRARTDDARLVAKEAITWAAENDPVRIVFVPAREMRVVVRDGVTGKPIADAPVRSVCGDEVTEDDSFRRRAWHSDEARANSEGRAVVRAPDGVACVYVGAAGYAGIATDPIYVGPAGVDVSVEMSRAGAVAGRVVDPQGAGVPDALVHAVGPTIFDVSTRTDAKGAFALADVPANTFGAAFRVSVSVRARGWGPTAARCELPAPGGTVELTIRLSRALTLTGRAVTRTGEPVAGVTVYARPSSLEWFAAERLGDDPAEATSNADGAFELTPVAPGPTDIESRRPNGYFFGSAKLTVPAEGEAPVVTLREEQGGSRSFVVRVEDAHGKPVPGAGVDALAADERGNEIGARVGWEDTDAEGVARFAGGLPAARVHFTAQMEGRASCKIVADLADPTLQEARIRYPSGTAEGRVRLRDGRAANVRLRLIRLKEDGSVGEWMTDCTRFATDAEGRFRLDALGDDAYTIESEEAGGVIVAPPAIRAGSEPLALLFLSKDEVAAQQVEIRLVDASGSPLAYAQINLLMGRGSEFDSIEGRLGSYRSPPLIEGRYDLRVKLEDCSARVVRGVRLVPGEPALVVPLDAGATLEGRVLAADGKPVGRAVLEIEGGTIETEEDGHFHAVGLPVGSFAVRIQGPFVRKTSQTLQIASGTTSDVVLRVESAGAILLVASKAPASVMLDVHVRLADVSAPEIVTQLYVWWEDEAEKPAPIGIIPGLPPGRYVVEVKAAGNSILSREVDVALRAMTTISLD